MKVLTRVFDFIINLLAYIGGVLSLLMMVGVSADVVGRYFLSKPILGMVEANQVMILWIVFLGAAWVLKKGRHVNMDIVLQMLEPRAQAWLNMITSLFAALMCLFLFWYGIDASQDLFRRGIIEVGNLAINSGYVVLAIPIGSLPLSIQFLRKSYQHWRQLRGQEITEHEPQNAGDEEG